MSDDLTKKGKEDRDRINHNQSWETEYLKKQQEEKTKEDQKKS